MPYYERNLPHWIPERRELFVTWRLSGSLPMAVVRALAAENQFSEGRRFAKAELELDAANFGPTWLRNSQIAAEIVSAMKKVRSERMCEIHSFVVMPNHVHLLLEPRGELARITQKLKGSTARIANRILGRTGESFWQDESFDHWIRDPVEFERVKAYIERNPVKAGLALRPEDWKWSSANPNHHARL